MNNEKVFALNIGEPIVDVDEGIIDFVNKNIKDKNIRYTPVSGLNDLKNAVSNWINETYNTKFDHKNILVTSGGKYALYLFL